MRDRKRLADILNAALFFGAVAAVFLLTVFLPKSDFSELENRYLAEKPEFSVSEWFSGRFSERLAEYSREHIVLRPRWISLHTLLERLSGKKEVNGVIFAGGSLFEAPEETDFSVADRSAAALISFSESLCGRLSVMLAPTAVQIYSDRLPAFSKEPSEKKLIDRVYSKLREGGGGAVDVYDSLYSARGDYIYYRTDHHWTTRGAYIAYSCYMRSLGYEPIPLDRIDVEHASHSFRGSLYSKVLDDSAEPDVVDFYYSAGPSVKSVRVTSADGTVSEHDSVIFRENLAKKDQYLSFLGENVPLIEIETDAGGGSILVIKDSYANCLVPFLCKHFGRVTVVDLRYMMRLSDYADPSDFDRVLVLYNASGFAADKNISKLAIEKSAE